MRNLLTSSPRLATFVASLCSSVCVIAVIVALPLMHFHSQRVASIILAQVEQCKVSALLELNFLVNHT